MRERQRHASVLRHYSRNDGRDCFNTIGPLLETPPGCIQTIGFYRLCGRAPSILYVVSSKVTRTHMHELGKCFDSQILAQILRDPSLELGALPRPSAGKLVERSEHRR